MNRDHDADGVPLSGPWPAPDGDADALTRPQPAVPAEDPYAPVFGGQFLPADAVRAGALPSDAVRVGALPADAVRCFPALRDDADPYAGMARHARPSPTPPDGTRLDLPRDPVHEEHPWRRALTAQLPPPPPPPRKPPRSLPAGLALALAVAIVAASALASYAVASRRAAPPARAPATVCVHVDRGTGFVRAITLPPCTGSARALVIP